MEILVGQSPGFLRPVRLAYSEKERQGPGTPAVPSWNIGQRPWREDLETHACELESAMGGDQGRPAAVGVDSGVSVHFKCSVFGCRCSGFGDQAAEQDLFVS